MKCKEQFQFFKRIKIAKICPNDDKFYYLVYVQCTYSNNRKCVWFKGCVIIVLLFRSTTAADRGPQAELTCWVKRRQGSAKPKRKQFFSSDFLKFLWNIHQFISQMFRIRKNWGKGKTSYKFTKFCLLDHSWNFYRSVHIYGILSKIKQFYRCQKRLFYSFWIYILSVLLSYRGFIVYTKCFCWTNAGKLKISQNSMATGSLFYFYEDPFISVDFILSSTQIK